MKILRVPRGILSKIVQHWEDFILERCTVDHEVGIDGLSEICNRIEYLVEYSYASTKQCAYLGNLMISNVKGQEEDHRWIQ